MLIPSGFRDGTYRDQGGRAVPKKFAEELWTSFARAALTDAARQYHGLISHEALAEEVQTRTGIRTRLPTEAWIGEILQRIGARCHEFGQPLLPALCVGDDGTSGEEYARVLDALYGERPADAEGHAIQQRFACYRRWYVRVWRHQWGLDIPAPRPPPEPDPSAVWDPDVAVDGAAEAWARRREQARFRWESIAMFPECGTAALGDAVVAPQDWPSSDDCPYVWVQESAHGVLVGSDDWHAAPLDIALQDDEVVGMRVELVNDIDLLWGYPGGRWRKLGRLRIGENGAAAICNPRRGPYSKFERHEVPLPTGWYSAEAFIFSGEHLGIRLMREAESD